MEKIVFIKKKGTLPTPELISIFERTDDLNEIRESVERADERIYVSWATVEMKDNAGEIIPIEDIIQQQQTLMERNGPILDNHEAKPIGQTLAYKLLRHPENDKLGVLHLDKIFNHNELDDKVWSEIVSGERTGSSVGGFNTEMSLGVDDKGEQVRVLDGFQHLETSSVFDPCNPLATNEAFSVVAKSNKSNVQKVDPGGDHVHDDENPAGLHTHSEIKNKLNKTAGDSMTKEESEEISDLKEKVKNLTSEVSKLKKEDMPEEEKPEDKKKQEEEEKQEDKPEEKKKQEEKPEEKQEEEEKKKVKKEEAASDIDGLTDAPQPDSPVVDDSNDADAFKKTEELVDEKVKKLKEELVTKFQTPFPGAGDVKKANEFSKLPEELAMGKKVQTWMDVHKKNREVYGLEAH